MKNISPAAWGRFFATLLTVLLAASVVSDYFRPMPEFFDYDKGMLSADALIFPDMIMQLRSGQAEMKDWFANPAPFWLTLFLPLKALISMTGGDWHLSLAMRRMLETLLLLGSLAAVIRLSSNRSWSGSVQLAAMPLAALFLTDLVFGGGGTLAVGNTGFRTFNLAMFFLSCAGLALVATSGKANRPLSWLYLAACFLFGAEDALLGVHVVFPVFLSSACWAWLRRGQGKACWGIPAVAMAGIALFVAGHQLNQHLSPFARNLEISHDTFSSLGVAHAARAVSEGNIASALPNFITRTFQAFTDNLLKDIDQEWVSEGILNSILLAFIVPVFALTMSKTWRGKGLSERRDVRETTVFFVLVTYWSLVVSTIASMIIVYARVRYAFVLVWASPLVLHIAWTGLGGLSPAGRAKVKHGASALLTLSLVTYVAFFRPEQTARDIAACTSDDGVLAGSVLERGLANFWFARESRMLGHSSSLHLQYVVYDFFEEPLVFQYRHVGNIQHSVGSADFAIVDNKDKAYIPGMRRQFGIPSRLEVCGRDSWMLYSKDRLAYADLHRRGYDAGR